MILDDVSLEMTQTDIYKLSFQNSRYKLLPDLAGLIKNKNTILLFNIDVLGQYLDQFDNIKIQGLSDEQYNEFRKSGIRHDKKKDIITVLSFNKNYFNDLSGSINKPMRNIVKRYSSRFQIEVKSHPNSLEEFNDFIERWKVLRKDRHHMLVAGYDKHFMKEYFQKYHDKLFGSFFYNKGVLIGYSILERVQKNLFNLLFRKVDTNYNSFSQYVDFESFKRLLSVTSESSIIINLEGDMGDSRLRFYKSHSFNVPQKHLDTYTISIIK